MAEKDARNPRRIYDRCYVRYGNKKGDDPMYYGRTPIQLTFRNNYQMFQNFLKGLTPDTIDFVKDPDLLLKERWFFYPSAWYWVKNGCHKKKDFREITRIVNGGYNGWRKRREIYRNLSSIIKEVS